MASKKTDVNPEIAEARGDFEADVKSEKVADTMLDANDRAGIKDDNPFDETNIESGDENPSEQAEPSQPPLHQEVEKKAKEEVELVNFIFPLNETKSSYFECSINCVKYKYKRGIPVKIPKHVYDFYCEMQRDVKNTNSFKSKNSNVID